LGYRSGLRRRRMSQADSPRRADLIGALNHMPCIRTGSQEMPTTEAQPITTTSPDGGDIAEGSCVVCPHPMAAHDRISARYCVATAEGSIERGCVCSAATTTNYRRS
jgi:hypothetical protein